MKESIRDTTNGLDYTLVSDHYLPNLTVAAPAEQHLTGRWGRLHKKYIWKNIIPSGTTSLFCPVSWAATLPSWINRPKNSLP